MTTTTAHSATPVVRELPAMTMTGTTNQELVKRLISDSIYPAACRGVH